ncbi:phage tail tape measure protein [Streptomyces sp. HGB0020]|uniref:phage tail tape measure protein n=1 Tax=Streptomyces sp. HGB0020 TaxID=1078086 RepID=UPI00034EC234|nr:phage tail tape measure protein [Streptomyces sp. HGB0020]EPD62394.1 hypothetical protein HMPREF1211_04028 [Streptomyces sp. HGB0020]
MALTVGELQALISIDDRAVSPALRRTEQALRQTGQTIGNDATTAGTRAGTNLGQGFVRGADGQWRTVQGNLVDAVTAAGLEAERDAHRAGARAAAGFTDGLGQVDDEARRIGAQAGDGLGDGLGDSGEAGADEATGRISGALGKLKVAALGIGATAGAFLVDSLGQALEQGQTTAKLGAQLGATPALAQRYGQAAGQLYKGAIVQNFDQGVEAIRATVGAGLVPPDATLQQLQRIGTKVSDLSNTFDVEFSEVSKSASVLLKTGLAKNADEAFDLITRGLTGLGPAGDDFLDTVTEYSVQWKDSGLSAQTAIGLMRQGIQAGSKDTDKIGDAFKELRLRGTEGSKAVGTAFQQLGLDAKQTGDDLAAGGKRGERAMGLVLDRLRKIGPNSQEAKQIVSTLFGGPGEDLGSALFELNVGKASKAMDGAKGSADKLGDGLRDNAASKVTAFKNSLQQNVVEFLGNDVLPKLTTVFGFVSEHSTAFKTAALFVGILGTAFSIAAIGVWAFNSAMLANPVFWIVAGIILVIAGLVLLVATYWDQIKAATLTVWDWITGKISGAVDLVLLVVGYLSKIPGMVSSFFSSMVRKVADIVVTWLGWVRGIPGKVAGALASMAGFLKSKAVEAFNAFRSSASAKVTSLISWARGIPGRVSGAIGAVKNLLYSKGRDIVTGLWNGIVGMGGWLRSKLIGWAKAIIPGPVAKALGIGSPSKVMAREVGHWIPAGIAKGAEDNAGVIEDTMQSLVDVPTPSASMALGVSSAMNNGGAVGGRSGGQQIPTFRLTGGDEFGDYVINTLRRRLPKYGGDVQFVLGK